MSLSHFYEGDNIGGLATISFAYHTDFSQWNPVKFLPGKSWQVVEIVGEAELKRRMKDTPHGLVYTYSGFFDIHPIHEGVEAVLMKMIGRWAVLRIEDRNGKVYLIGHPGNPVTLEEESTTGKLPKSKNGYQFNFSVSQTMSASSN